MKTGPSPGRLGTKVIRSNSAGGNSAASSARALAWVSSHASTPWARSRPKSRSGIAPAPPVYSDA